MVAMITVAIAVTIILVIFIGDADAMTAALGGLGLHRVLTLAVLDDPVQVSPMF
jgi:hypothetical protein